MSDEVTYWYAPNGENYPLKDAEHSLMATVLEEDIACATPLNPCACAITQSFMRAAGSPIAMTGRMYAYVVVNQGGKEVALRFLVPKATRDAIDLFDRTGTMKPDTLTLRPPPPSHSLKGTRAKAKRLRHRWEAKGYGPEGPRERHIRHDGKRNATNLANTAVRKLRKS